MSLLQHNDNDMSVALKLRLPRPFFRGRYPFQRLSCSAPCNQLFQKKFFECFYNYLELSKKVSFIFLSQILTDLEICHIAFLYISLVISDLSDHINNSLNHE